MAKRVILNLKDNSNNNINIYRSEISKCIYSIYSSSKECPKLFIFMKDNTVHVITYAEYMRECYLQAKKAKINIENIVNFTLK